MQYNIVSQGDYTSITAFIKGEMYVADSSHPRFEAIRDGVLEQDDSVAGLFDLSTVVAESVKTLSPNVEVRGHTVYVHQAPVEDAYAQRLVDYVLGDDVEDQDWEALVLFLEKVYSNVDESIRENLARWLNGEKFTILSDGNILAYRGLTRDMRSKHAGPGYINGVYTDGYHDCSVGNTVSIMVDDVEVNPAVGCASGLHVGTYDYAVSWAGGGVVVAVKVDPRHVRSVPHECESAKMRVSQYVVLRVVDEKVSNYTEATAESDDAYDAADNLNDCCDDCGQDLDYCDCGF